MHSDIRLRFRRLLPGVAASVWLLCCGPFALVLAGGSLYFGVISGGKDLGILNGLFIVTGFGLAFFGLYSCRTARELEAGYTTDPWRHPQVDFCDWKTGAVLRSAGEPIFPNWAAFRATRRLARRRVVEPRE